MVKALQQLDNLQIWLLDTNDGGVVVQTTVESSLVAEVKKKQYDDAELVSLKDNIVQQKQNLFDCGPTRVLIYNSRYVCVM